MLSPHIHAALAHERHQAYLAQAETDRRARQARLHRRQAGTPGARRSPRRWRPAWLQRGRSRLFGLWPRSAVTGRPVVLRDGSTVLIRPVRSADAPLLADGFARLSARSRQLRFLTPKKELSPAELRYFTDVDHHDHEALGALNHADGRGVGIARYVRDADDPQAAEIAVTIVDDWQGRGLGTELVAQLSERARSEGIRRFTALVAADNAAVAGLLRNVRADLVRREPGALQYEIMLAPVEEHSPAGVPRSGRQRQPRRCSRNAFWVHPPGAPDDPRRAVSALSLDAAKITVNAAAMAACEDSRTQIVRFWAISGGASNQASPSAYGRWIACSGVGGGWRSWTPVFICR
jgi:RimJ/RimL family protein N-acetyltransferase